MGHQISLNDLSFNYFAYFSFYNGQNICPNCAAIQNNQIMNSKLIKKPYSNSKYDNDSHYIIL